MFPFHVAYVSLKFQFSYFFQILYSAISQKFCHFLQIPLVGYLGIGRHLLYIMQICNKLPYLYIHMLYFPFPLYSHYCQLYSPSTASLLSFLFSPRRESAICLPHDSIKTYLYYTVNLT